MVKKAYKLKHTKASFREKINSLYRFIRKQLLVQNKAMQLHPQNDVSFVSLTDVNEIVNDVTIKDELNKSSFNATEKLSVKDLVLEVIENLPITLITKELYKKQYIGGEAKERLAREDSMIISQSNSKSKLLNKLLQQKSIEQQNKANPFGEGRKPRDRNGTEDQTEIWDITNWPSQCKTNQNQSPININAPYDPEILLLTLNYSTLSNDAQLFNEKFKMVLKANSFGSIQYNLHKYIAKEIHFHYPSEHTFGKDERRSAMEMQIIHEDIYGNLAAVAVLFDVSLNDSEFLTGIGLGVDDPDFALKLRNNEKITIKNKLDLGKLLNGDSHYVHYTGSLTTPPCNPNVEWFVMLSKLEVSQRQLDYFPVLFGLNSNVRGLQPLAGRVPKII